MLGYSYLKISGLGEGSMSSLLKSVSVEMIEIILENAFEWLVVVDEGGRSSI